MLYSILYRHLQILSQTFSLFLNPLMVNYNCCLKRHHQHQKCHRQVSDCWKSRAVSNTSSLDSQKNIVWTRGVMLWGSMNVWLIAGETDAEVSISDERGWRREAEHCFTMWCSGRVCCEGMLLTLKLIKVILSGYFKKTKQQNIKFNTHLYDVIFLPCHRKKVIP